MWISIILFIIRFYKLSIMFLDDFFSFLIFLIKTFFCDFLYELMRGLWPLISFVIVISPFVYIMSCDLPEDYKNTNTNNRKHIVTGIRRGRIGRM
jgi:hypothetical protein